MFDPKLRPAVDGDALRAQLIAAGLLRPNPNYLTAHPDGPNRRPMYKSKAMDDADDFGAAPPKRLPLTE